MAINKYKVIYQQIIRKARERKKSNPLNPEHICIERHHVKPRCLGGGNSKRNVVELTAREHFICHWLLYKVYNNEKLAC